jgi:hypothetical protein
MVHEEVPLDMLGIPEKIPSLYYRRVPLIITKPDSYEDWKRRRAGVHRWIDGIEEGLKEIKLEADRIVWERNLRARPPVQLEKLEMNKKIVEVLKGGMFEIRC